jgi:hypothetical protein
VIKALAPFLLKFTTMNIYNYVAHNNPIVAKAICTKFGYRVSNVNSKDDLGECLRQVVASEGEPALKEIVKNHPDKEIILEYFSNDQFAAMDGTGGNYKTTNECSCQKKCECQKRETYANADGSNQSKSLTAQTNVILVAASLFLAVAIIYRN